MIEDYRLNGIIRNIKKRLISKINRENNNNEDEKFYSNPETLAEISSSIIIDFLLSNRADLYGYVDYIIENQEMTNFIEGLED